MSKEPSSLTAAPLPTRSADPGLASELGQPLEEVLAFFGSARDAYSPLLLAALSEATG